MRELPDVPLSTLTTLRLGGPAKRLLEVTTSDELVEAVADCDRRGEPLLVLGGGSNVVLADGGFAGTVVLIRTRGITVAEEPATVQVRVAAGEDWDALVAFVVAAGYAGLEALAGIPGSTGATPIQNVGAYGQEVAHTIREVVAWDRNQGQRIRIAAEDCGFAYRHSRFKGIDRYVVLEVVFQLDRNPLSAPVAYAELARTLGVEIGGRAPLAAVREAVLRLRRGKGMVLDADDPDTWSAGSFFTNPLISAEVAAELPAAAPRYPHGEQVKTSAAWLIERAGFGKGYGLDRTPAPVSLSTKHTLALTNRGGGSAAELVGLAREIRDRVHAEFGIELVPEPVFVGLSL